MRKLLISRSLQYSRELALKAGNVVAHYLGRPHTIPSFDRRDNLAMLLDRVS
jgi:hypothetical protein